jgi:hypothetical protein
MNGDFLTALMDEDGIPQGTRKRIFQSISSYEQMNRREMTRGQQYETAMGLTGLSDQGFRYAYGIAKILLSGNGYDAKEAQVLLEKVIEARGYLASATPGEVKRFVDAAAGVTQKDLLLAGEVHASLRYHLDEEHLDGGERAKKLRTLVDRAGSDLMLEVSWDDLTKRAPEIAARLDKISYNAIGSMRNGEASQEIMRLLCGRNNYGQTEAATRECMLPVERSVDNSPTKVRRNLSDAAKAEITQVIMECGSVTKAAKLLTGRYPYNTVLHVGYKDPLTPRERERWTWRRKGMAASAGA